MSEEYYHFGEQGSGVCNGEVQGSKAKGFVGALIGAIVGTMPMAILGVFGLLSGWLGIIAVYGAYKGYLLMNGIRHEKFAKKAILFTSGMCVILTSMIIVLFYLVMGEDASSLGGIAVIPFVSLGIGYSLVKRKLWVYANPEGYQARMEQAHEVLEEERDIQFYIPKEKASILARIVIVVTFLIALFTGGLGMCALVIGTNLALMIGGISSCVCMGAFIYITLALVGVNQASQTAIVKMGENRIFTVHTQKLNQINEYHFSTRSNLVAMNVATLGSNEMQLFQSSIMRAIQDIDRGSVPTNAPICKAVVELRSSEVLKDKNHQVKVRYTNRQGGTKQVTLHKIYSQLTVFGGISMDKGSMQPNYVACVVVVLLSMFLGIAGIGILTMGMYTINESARNVAEEQRVELDLSSDVADSVADLEATNEALEEILAELEGETDNVVENEYEEEEGVMLTDENYQDFNLEAEGFEYVTVRFYKGKEAYVDAYVPNGEVTYVDEGYGIESTLYGVRTYTTMEGGYTTAEEVVHAYFAEKVASGMEVYESYEVQTYYDPDWDIAIINYLYIEEEMLRPIYLYADTHGEGNYMYSEITYIIEDLREESDALAGELSKVYAFELPKMYEVAGE